MSQATVWTAGRFDARPGPERVLFGRMYEDTAIERAAFRPAGRVFCIASAGCTALALSRDHEVVACDINPMQLRYAERRIRGAPVEVGTAEKVMGFGRTLMPLAGWSAEVVGELLGMTDPVAQTAFWAEHLDTWRFRTGFDLLMSMAALRAVYAADYLDFLPKHFGRVMRGRMARCFARHANATNPYARLLLLGSEEASKAGDPPSGVADHITLVLSDAASYLESCAAGSFDGFTLSNILDGAKPEYRERLARAVRHAAADAAVVVLRSFGDPPDALQGNKAADDRAMLWGIVDVRTIDTANPPGWLPPTKGEGS